jgi:hypothetical protein
MPKDLLETSVATYERLVDDQGFVLAFWPDSKQPSALGVVAGNVKTGRWARAELPVDAGSSDFRLRPGPIWSIWRRGRFTLVGVRVAIDGIATYVLNEDLRRVAVMYGVVQAILPHELIVYQPAQPHFAPTHYVRLVALDPATSREREIYPTRPYDRVRLDEIARARARLAALGGDPWCMKQNHHCDPELFDSSMEWRGPIAINETTKTIAFPVRYADGVMVTCGGIDRLESIACHETPIALWRRAFPRESDTRLLEHAAADPQRVRYR